MMIQPPHIPLTPETLHKHTHTHTHTPPPTSYCHAGILWQVPVKPAHESFMDMLRPANTEQEQYHRGEKSLPDQQRAENQLPLNSYR